MDVSDLPQPSDWEKEPSRELDVQALQLACSGGHVYIASETHGVIRVGIPNIEPWQYCEPGVGIEGFVARPTLPQLVFRSDVDSGVLNIATKTIQVEYASKHTLLLAVSDHFEARTNASHSLVSVSSYDSELDLTYIGTIAKNPCAAFSGDESCLATTVSDNLIHVVHITTSEVMNLLFVPSNQVISDLVMAGNRLIAITTKGLIVGTLSKTWIQHPPVLCDSPRYETPLDVSKGWSRILQGHDHVLAMSPCRTMIATACRTHGVVVMNVETGDVLADIHIRPMRYAPLLGFVSPIEIVVMDGKTMIKIRKQKC